MLITVMTYPVLICARRSFKNMYIDHIIFSSNTVRKVLFVFFFKVN